MEELLPGFFNELRKIARAATLTWGMEHDPTTLPPMQDGMYPFAGTPRILPSDSPGFYKPPLPQVRGRR